MSAVSIKELSEYRLVLSTPKLEELINDGVKDITFSISVFAAIVTTFF